MNIEGGKLFKAGWIVFGEREGKVMTHPFKDGTMPTIYLDKDWAEGVAEIKRDENTKTWIKKAELWVEP